MKLIKEVMQEYKNLLEMLTSLNEQITKDPLQTDLAVFAERHKTILTSLQEKSEEIANNASLQQEYSKEYSAYLNEVAEMIAAIKQEEEKALQLLQKDYQHVKDEISRIQSMKRANPQYNMNAQREAVFIDKIK